MSLVGTFLYFEGTTLLFHLNINGLVVGPPVYRSRIFIAEIIVRKDVFLVVYMYYYIHKVNLHNYTVLNSYKFKGTMVLGAM